MGLRSKSSWLIGAVGAVGVAVAVAVVSRGPGLQTASVEAIEAYPQRGITIVAWVTPGSPTDLLARAIASVGPRYFGQRITVLNKQGGGGAVAMSYLLGEPPDGYTLAINTSSGSIAMAAGHVPFTPDQFTNLMLIQLDPFVIAVRASSPFQDLQDIFEYAAEKPGELSMAGFGTASAHFLAFSRLKAEAGNPNVRWVAYDGSADANVAVLGGHTDLVNTNYSVVKEYVRAGTMRLLGASSRLPALPEVETYAEQGYDLEPMHWRGLMGPGGMAPALVAKIRELMQATVTDPEFQTFMQSSGTLDGAGVEPGNLQAWIEDDVRATRQLLEELNLSEAARN